MNRNDCKSIHETYLKDIMDIWDGIKNIAKDGGLEKILSKKGPMLGKSSLAKASSNLVMVFPVICSRGISIENASMVSKAIEKNATTMLQRMFASWQVMDSSDVSSVEDYIRQFHANISSRAVGLDELFKIANAMDESVIEPLAEFKNDMRNLDYYLPTDINEDSLRSYTVHEGAVRPPRRPRYSRDRDNDRDNSEDYAFEKLKNIAATAKNYSDYFKNQVSDGEFKKANELMPTSLIVNFSIKDNNKIIDYQNAVVGVKAKLYPISSEDIIKHISEKNTDKNWLTNFFRATTREISFMKDFVLAIDKAKIDAMSMSVRNSTSDKMWKVLERRATTSRLKRAMRQNNTAAAITTLCISQEEIEYLRKNYNMDMERVSNVISLFESLNLMCICIVDESLEVAKFIYDEDEPMWETISFTHLERESSDNTYKRVVNLMTKMSR